MNVLWKTYILLDVYLFLMCDISSYEFLLNEWNNQGIAESLENSTHALPPIVRHTEEL